MKSNKSQIVLDFLMTYGWAILVVLVAVAALAYFYFNCESAPKHSVWFKKNCPTNIPIPIVVDSEPDVFVDSEPELLDICNRLVVNNEVYPFLEVMGNGLRKANGAEFVAYKSPAELRSNLDIFNVDELILCGVPIELCYIENNDIKGGTYCILMRLEVPIDYNEFSGWYQKVSGDKNV